MLFFSCSDFLDLLGRLHEEWKDGPEAQNVDKLVTVVRALRPDHGVVQHLQGAAAGNLLLSAESKLGVKLFRDTRSFGPRCFRETA